MAGAAVRIRFAAVDGTPTEMLRVEEGRLRADGDWTTDRVWNGDQIDYGLNLTHTTMLRVTLSQISR